MTPYCLPVPRIEYALLSSFHETRPVCLVFTRAAWAAVSDTLRLNVASWIEVTEASLDDWRRKSAQVRGELIVAVGGGLSVDAAKFFASAHDLPLLSIPTALSVDAFFTWASGYRENGCVHYLETKPPEHVLVDWDIIRQGPASIRMAGICDVLSIATGRWDWRFAEEQGKNPPGAEFVGWVDSIAESLLEATLDCAAAVGQGDVGGMKTLLDCLLLEVQMCNQIGHSRPEEGSEHYFAYSVENTMGKGLPHGDLVGPGILIAAALQGQNTERLREALHACAIPLGNIPREVIHNTLLELPAYCETHELPFGIAHTITLSQIDSVMASYPHG